MTFFIEDFKQVPRKWDPSDDRSEERARLKRLVGYRLQHKMVAIIASQSHNNMYILLRIIWPRTREACELKIKKGVTQKAEQNEEISVGDSSLVLSLFDISCVTSWIVY